MLKLLSASIKRHELLRPGDRLGVAVSGGADSVALLRAMLELRAELGIVLSVVHLHHGIRGTEADADERFVAELARRFDLPFHCDRADVPRFGKEHSLSLEAAARKLRYGFFEKLLRERVLDKIATAHTADDQAETVLLRFLRGSGTRGLAGIHPALRLEGGPVVRPMLDVSRADVLAYLKSLGQDWREDATNADTRHTRNRVRHQLLPLLERDYNPALRQLLGEVAQVSRDEEAFWSELIGSLAEEVLDQHGQETHLLLGLPATESPAVRRRLIRLAAERSGIRLDFHHVEQLLGLVSSSSKGEVELPNGWRARRVGRKADLSLLIEPALPEPSIPGYEYDLSIPSEVQIAPLGTSVRVTAVRYTEVKGRYNPASLLDRARLGAPLRLRNWRPGDRLRPLHRASGEKLKRLFQQLHIPAEKRAFWPVLTSGDTVVWAMNLPVAAEFAAREDTAEALYIEAVEL